MLAMARVNLIRDLRNVEGMSISQIARTMNVNWRTAKKYADGDVFPEGDGPRARRPRPVIGGYTDTIDLWLMESQRMPGKHRWTAKRIYQELMRLGYEGSERTVRAYVRESKRRISSETAERYIRLEHRPGEAQVDFGKVQILKPGGQIREYCLLIMSFPYSNAAFARILPAENAECLLEGLKSLFEQAGGVPVEIWFDNMSTAVIKVLSGGKRIVTDAFGRFRWHYRFQAKFCNAGKANEKGNIEGKVGYVRRNYLTPLAVTDDIESLNRKLAQDLGEDMDRDHYRKKVSMKDLWDQDQNALLPLPTQPYEASRPMTAVVNHMGEIRVDGHTYHVPQAAPRQRVLLKILWDRIVVYRSDGQKLGQVPRHYTFKADQVEWAAELRVLLRKPRAAERSTYLEALPQVLRDFIVEVNVKGRRARMKSLIALFEAGYSLSDVTETVRMGLRLDATDTASLRVLAGHTGDQELREDIPEPHTPESVLGWRPDLGRYDLLTGEVAGHD